MSKAGNFAAYQQYRPLPDTVTPAINNWANFVQQKEAQANLQRERDLNRKEREDEKRQGDLDKWAKNLIPIDSGIADLNALNGRILQESMKEYERHIPTLLKGDINDPNYLKSKLAVENLHALPDKLKQLSDQKASELKDYLDGRDSKYIIDPELDKLTKDFSQWSGGIDPETGELIIKMGNEVKPYKDAINSQIKPIPKFDMDKHAQELAKALDKTAKENKKEVWNPITNSHELTYGIKDKELEAVTKLTLDGKPTEYGISYLAQAGFDMSKLETEEGQAKLQELEKALLEKTSTYLPEGFVQKYDSASVDRQKRLAFDRQKLASDNANKEADRNLKKQVAKGKGELSSIGEFSKGDSNFWLNAKFDENSATIPLTNVNYGAIANANETEADPNSKVQAITFAKDGSVLMKVEYTKKTAIGEETKVKIRKGGDSHIGKLAEHLGVTKAELKKAKDFYKTEEETPTEGQDIDWSND